MIALDSLGDHRRPVLPKVEHEEDEEEGRDQEDPEKEYPHDGRKGEIRRGQDHADPESTGCFAGKQDPGTADDRLAQSEGTRSEPLRPSLGDTGGEGVATGGGSPEQKSVGSGRRRLFPDLDEA